MLLLASACRKDDNNPKAGKNVTKRQAGDVDSGVADHFDTGFASCGDAALLE